MTTELDQRAARELAAAGPEYRSGLTVQATRLTAPVEWISRSGSALHGSVGDWLLASDADPDDRWTVLDEVFRRTYAREADGHWRKTATVRAIRLTEAVLVDTSEGLSLGRAGDWLVVSAIGGAWPVADTEFAARYRPVD